MARKLSVSVLILVVSLSLCLQNVSALFGSEKKKLKKLQEEEAARLLAEEAAAAEAAAATKMVNIPFLDIEVEQNILCTFVVMTIISIFLMLLMGKKSEEETCETSKIGNRPNTSGTLDVVLVGCGLPKRGMGWYHLTQLLDMKNVNVVGVVEPFFMNPNLCKSPPASWTEFVDQTSKVSALTIIIYQRFCIVVVLSLIELITGPLTSRLESNLYPQCKNFQYFQKEIHYVSLLGGQVITLNYSNNAFNMVPSASI